MVVFVWVLGFALLFEAACLPRPSKQHMKQVPELRVSAIEGLADDEGSGSGAAATTADLCDVNMDEVASQLQGYAESCLLNTSLGDCCQLKLLKVNKSGIYNIAGALAYCDMETAGGGWMVLLRRATGGRDFDKSWNHYRRGFGVLDREFWFGLQKIHELTTSSRMELMVVLKNATATVTARYSTFRVSGQRNKYRLRVGRYSGNAGDALRYHDGLPFTTIDNDNDQYLLRNCAEMNYGGWWYGNCYKANLNGDYSILNDGFGVPWMSDDYVMHYYTFAEVKMRPLLWQCT